MPIEGLVSTIIPVYNRADMLRLAVGSVLDQTYRPVEIVIVDDGSTDDTPEAISALCKAEASTVRSVRRPNGGPGAARQSGLDMARGEFIQFLDSDDLLLRDKFTLQVAALRRDRSCDVAYGKTRYHRLGERPRDEPLKRTGEFIATMFPAFVQSRWWSTSTPLYRRSIIDSAGPWTNLRNEEDWEFECRIASLDVRLAYCDEFVSDTLDHDGDRLSANGSSDPTKLHNRAEAHRMIFGHARAAGIGCDTPEMQHFARELFLLARQCGAAGLSAEARMLFDLSRAASTPEHAGGLDFRLYGLAARLLGWQATGWLAAALDRLRDGARVRWRA